MRIEATPINRNVRFDARCQRNRPGLLLLNGAVYIAFGTFSCDSNCPDGNYYRGWVMGYRTSDLSQTAVFCTSPDGGGAGVWQSGNGLVGSDDGTIYFETGNDTVPAKLGDSFIKLQAVNASPGFVHSSTFTPSNAALLRDGHPTLHDGRPTPGTIGDVDLGSGGPLLLPGGRLIGGGKQGRYYVLDQNTLQPTQDSRKDPVLGEGFQAFMNTYHPDYTIADYAVGELPGPNMTQSRDTCKNRT